MNKIVYAFHNFIVQIAKDFMMIACVSAPIMMGCVFCFLIPIFETVLCEYFQKAAIIQPYYAIFDLLLAIMTPIMFCFAGVLVILEELDNGTSRYYFVTPVGKSGYLFSRLVIPVVLAWVYDIVLLGIFSLGKVNILENLMYSLSGSLLAIISALLVISFAKNKMEGMALIKLCGLLMIGLPVVYFVNSPIQYIFCFIPSFWMAKISITGESLFLVPTIFTSSLFIFVLYRKFTQKIA